MTSNPVFHRKILTAALERFDVGHIPNLQAKKEILATWKDLAHSEKLKTAGEAALHGDFLIDMFATVLGYTRITETVEEWQLSHEQKTQLDATKADGALGFFTKDSADIRAVIELKKAGTDLDAKQHRTQDKRSPVEQAFGYVPKSGKRCGWVIVSNYEELRLYRANTMEEYECFKIADLTDEHEFRRFYYLLACQNLIAKKGESMIDALYRKSEEEEKNISKRFYAEYTQARPHLFEHLKQRNIPVSQASPPGFLIPGRDAGVQAYELFLLQKTQKLLDRFIFICFCEDTGKLPERIFRKLVTRAQESFAFAEEKIWTELKGLFRALDQGVASQKIPPFNGELFKPDLELETLKIGDEIFHELANITDYDFESDLNVNILGHIFEQSITDLEELRADITGETHDRKQGRRKKEGIFYTPEYITRYIVENAVGGWLEDRKQELGVDELPELTPADYESIKLVKSGYKGNKKIEQHRTFWEAYKEKLMNIKVLDPACGSGAFLNQAFKFLHDEGQRVNAALADLSKGQTSAFDLNKHILSNNLYGVDLNRESVEITKLSLWLLTARKDAPLTALDQNIKCGNSLIEDPLVAGEKAFKWEQEFPEVMQRGGFDVVIGNPPYVRQEALGAYKPYFERWYQVYHGMADLYVYFIERGMSLLKPNGLFSIIVSNKWMRANYGNPLRTWLQQYQIQGIVDFGELPVFEDAATFPCILSVAKTAPIASFNAVKVKTLDFSSLEEYCQTDSYAVNQSTLQEESWALVAEGEQTLLHKLKAIGVPLGEYVQGQIYRGVVTGCNDVFLIDAKTRNQILAEDSKSADIIKPFVVGDDVRKYHINYQERYLIFTRRGIDMKAYPAIERYLLLFKERLMPKPKDWTGARWEGRKSGPYEWFEIQDTINYYTEFEKSKIIYPEIGKESRFTWDTNNFYPADTVHIIPSSDLYLLGVLNSKLIFNYFKRIASVLGDEDKGGRLRWKGQYMSSLPIRPINFSNPSDKAQHDFIVERVNTMLDLHTQRQALDSQFLKLLTSEFSLPKLSVKLRNWSDLDWKDFEQELQKAKIKLSLTQKSEWMEYFETHKANVTAIQHQIERTDNEIDKMVYELYGLTEEEIRIVEGK